MATAVQVFGAALVLGAFALAQTDRWTPHAYPYLLVNLLGATILALSAVVARQWGFVLLNATWAAVSVAGLARRAQRPEP